MIVSYLKSRENRFQVYFYHLEHWSKCTWLESTHNLRSFLLCIILRNNGEFFYQLFLLRLEHYTFVCLTLINLLYLYKYI